MQINITSTKCSSHGCGLPTTSISSSLNSSESTNSSSHSSSFMYRSFWRSLWPTINCMEINTMTANKMRCINFMIQKHSKYFDSMIRVLSGALIICDLCHQTIDSSFLVFHLHSLQSGITVVLLIFIDSRHFPKNRLNHQQCSVIHWIEMNDAFWQNQFSLRECRMAKNVLN